jgi:hypothetical protein
MNHDPLQDETNQYMVHRLAARALVGELNTWCIIQRSNPWRHRQELAVAGIVKRATDQIQQLEAMYDAETHTTERVREECRMFLTIAGNVIREAGIVPDLQDDLRALLRSRDFKQGMLTAAEEMGLA